MKSQPKFFKVKSPSQPSTQPLSPYIRYTWPQGTSLWPHFLCGCTRPHAVWHQPFQPREPLQRESYIVNHRLCCERFLRNIYHHLTQWDKCKVIRRTIICSLVSIFHKTCNTWKPLSKLSEERKPIPIPWNDGHLICGTIPTGIVLGQKTYRSLFIFYTLTLLSLVLPILKLCINMNNMGSSYWVCSEDFFMIPMGHTWHSGLWSYRNYSNLWSYNLRVSLCPTSSKTMTENLHKLHRRSLLYIIKELTSKYCVNDRFET